MPILLTFCNDKQVEQLDRPEMATCKEKNKKENVGKHKAKKKKKKKCNSLFSCFAKIL
jgi:hypothetical protein